MNTRGVMADRQLLHLASHRLAHIPELKVDPIVFESRFTSGSSMCNCNASCCQGGVMIDLEEKENILSQSDLIIRHMEPHQPRDPEQWFDREVEENDDFPSGQATGTQAGEQGCVFLMKDGRCVLQATAEKEGMPKHSLKPFFCFAFPITIDSGVLTVDDPELTNRTQCCSVISNGALTVLEVCSEELDFVLGKDGVAELKALAEKRA